MNLSSSAPMVTPNRLLVSSLVLGFGFSLTGAGTIMLGVLLPVLSQKWGFRDDQSGFLLFLLFLGSSLGAVFTGADRIRSLRIGYGLLVATAFALAFAGARTLFPAIFFWGLGLGLAMTATSLLFSDRYGDDRAVKLEQLNFAWSTGAMVTPLLLLPFLHGVSLRLLFFTFLALFLLLLAWALLREGSELLETFHTPAPAGARPRSSASPASFLLLMVLAMCAVGVETALSGWLTTYSHRAHPYLASHGAFATALFEFGIVFSRLIFSTRLLAIIGQVRVLRLALWGVAASVALLIVGHHAVVIDLASALSGLSIGPLYPLLLAFLLERSPRGWVFAVAGMGAAIFPWLTGALSTHFGSLRYGLIAPCGAALLMIVLSSADLRNAGSSRQSMPYAA